MLSIDLFDSKFEKQLHEGAVDDAEYARLKKLGEKIDYLKQARAKTTDSEMHRAIDRRIEQYDSERREILSVRGMNEVNQPQRQPAKGLLKGRDLVTPQQRVAGATPQKPGVMGAVKDVVGGIKRFVKGEPDQGPTYEQEEPQSPPLKATLSPGIQTVTELIAAWDAELDYLDLPLPDGTSVPVTRPAIFNALVQLKNIQQNRPRKYVEYVNKNFADKDTFFRWLANIPRFKTPPKKKKQAQPGLDLTPPPVQPVGKTEPNVTAPAGPMVSQDFRKDVGLSERKTQKKKSDSNVLDVKLNREIAKARARFPTAGSDLEALSLDQMTVNDQQDGIIQSLQQELDTVSNQNQSLQQAVQSLGTRIAQTKSPAPAQIQPPEVVTPAIKPKVSPAPEPTAVGIPTTQPTPVTVGVPAPQIPEPAKEKLPAKAKKSRVKKLPAKDMGAAVQVGADGDLMLPEPDVGFDFGKLALGNLEKLAGQEAEKVIKKAKGTKKQKAAVDEHGGGIGPRQHWQSMMRNEGWSDKYNPTPYAVYIDGRQWKVFGSDEHARAVAEKVRANLKRQGRDQTVTIAPSQEYLKGGKVKETFDMPGTTIPRKSVIQGYTVFFNPETQTISVTRGGHSEEAAIEQARIATANLRSFKQTAERLIDRIESADEEVINENIKDVAGAAAVIACLLTGGSLTGCATAPQKTTAQQVLKTGQDVGRTVQTAKRITRAGLEAEVNQEIRNLLRGMGNRPEELNTSNILRIWRRIKGQPSVQPEPQAPEYGPAEPVKRPAQFEAKEIGTREEFVRERDRLLRMITQETNPANKQILRSAIRQLESRAENEGWITIQQRMIRESNASGAAEQAIIKRIMVAHTDLLQQYGPEKVMQAAEEVAYNVGDLEEIGSSDVSGWVDQVKQTLGATP